MSSPGTALVAAAEPQAHLELQKRLLRRFKRVLIEGGHLNVAELVRRAAHAGRHRPAHAVRHRVELDHGALQRHSLQGAAFPVLD